MNPNPLEEQLLFLEKKFGDKPDMLKAETRLELARYWKTQERFRRSALVYQEAIDEFELLGMNDRSIDLRLVGLYEELAGLWRQQGSNRFAFLNLNHALKVAKRHALGQPHEAVINALLNLGSLCEGLWKLQDAVTYYQQAFDQVLVLLGENHEDSLYVRDQRDRVQQKLRSKKNAS